MRFLTQLCCLLYVLTIPIMAQVPVEVRVRTEDSWFQNDSEWKTLTYADLYDENENLIPPSEAYYYYWEYRIAPDTTWLPEGGAQGYGHWWDDFDGNYGETHHIRVRVTVDSTVLQSDGDAIISKSGVPSPVFCFAKKQDQEPFLGLSLQNWTGTSWQHNVVQSSSEIDPQRFFLAHEADEWLRIIPDYLPLAGQKFRHWLPSQTDVINYKSQFISAQTNQIRPQYWTNQNDAIFQDYLFDAPSMRDSIEFMDPWLPDLDTGTRGLRNQGMNAPFKRVASPLNPNSNASGDGSEYKGVSNSAVTATGCSLCAVTEGCGQERTCESRPVPCGSGSVAVWTATPEGMAVRYSLSPTIR